MFCPLPSTEGVSLPYCMCTILDIRECELCVQHKKRNCKMKRKKKKG